MRAINALDNIRAAVDLLEQSIGETRELGLATLGLALAETDDAINVLAAGGLHPQAVADLREARRLAKKASRSIFSRRRLSENAIRELEQAREDLIETPGS